MSESATLATTDEQEPLIQAMDPPPAGRPRWQWISLGVVAAAVAFVLREAGLLSGLAAVAVLVLCVVFAPGPRRASERFLLLCVLVLGWLPLLGWIPSIGTRVDLPGVLLAIAVGVVVAHQFRPSLLAARTMALPTVTEGVGLGLGAAVALWWAQPFARLSPSGLLFALTGMGWDNATHFSMYSQNVQLGSFIQVRPDLRGGAPRLGYDYPQGLHQSWAQLTRLVAPHAPSANVWLLHSYATLLLITTGVAVAMGCMAISRVSRRDLFVALPAMAVVVALFGLGRFPAVDGFPNYVMAIVASAIGVSLMLRPTLTPRWNFFLVAGMGLIVVYNWYPMVLLMAPALVVVALRAISGDRGRARAVTIGFIAATAIAYVLPVVAFAHRGVSWLDHSGSWIVPPWGMLIISIAALILAVMIRHSAHRDLTTNAILAAPAVLGGLAIIVVVLYEAGANGSIAYYGEKIASGVWAVCLIVLACLLASDVSTSAFRRRLSVPVMAVAAAVLSFAILQVDGYVGPSPYTLLSTNNALGIGLHDQLRKSVSQSTEAQRLLQMAGTTRGLSGQWCYVDPPAFNNDPMPSDTILINAELAAEWYTSLRGDPPNATFNRCVSVGSQLQGTKKASVVARTIINDFPDPIANNVHLVVPWWLRIAMVRIDPSWGHSGQLVVIPGPSPPKGLAAQL